MRFIFICIYLFFCNCVCSTRNGCRWGHRKTKDNRCIPHCDNCENGVCIEPNICECKTGYVKTHNVCAPSCSSGCTRGRCVAPEICEDIKQKSECANNCQNGVCNASNQCICKVGYGKDFTGQCQPVYIDGCLHGHCEAPETLKCHKGYTLKVSKICEPVCSSGCPHGNCIAPETSGCKIGYERDDRGHCQTIKGKAPSNTASSAKNVCESSNGFQNSNNETRLPPELEENDFETILYNACCATRSFALNIQPICEHTVMTVNSKPHKLLSPFFFRPSLDIY